MRFRPRFSVRTLAIFVAIVALILACGMWWVTWPRRTADRVVELLNNDQFNEALPFLATENDREYLEILEALRGDIGRDIPRFCELNPRDVMPAPRDRSWSDIIRGRQVFLIGFHFDIGVAVVTVERGSVSIAGSAPFHDISGALEKREALKRVGQELEQSLREELETPVPKIKLPIESKPKP